MLFSYRQHWISISTARLQASPLPILTGGRLQHHCEVFCIISRPISVLKSICNVYSAEVKSGVYFGYIWCLLWSKTRESMPSVCARSLRSVRRLWSSGDDSDNFWSLRRALSTSKTFNTNTDRSTYILEWLEQHWHRNAPKTPSRNHFDTPKIHWIGSRRLENLDSRTNRVGFFVLKSGF